MNKKHIVEIEANLFHDRFAFSDLQDAMKFANLVKAQGSAVRDCIKDGEQEFYELLDTKVSVIVNEPVYQSEEEAEDAIDRRLRSEMEEDLREINSGSTN
ncbi:MAG: hypothetical protein VW498_02125 [Candidatus Thalassarchaeaceae archaeon]